METACKLLDNMIGDERKAPDEYRKLKMALITREKTSSDPELMRYWISTLMDEHIDDENKHFEALSKLKEVLC